MIKRSVLYRVVHIVFIYIGFMPLVGNAATFNIGSMNITAGEFDIDTTDSVPGQLFSFFGPNTNLVGGYIGNGGIGLSAAIPDPSGIVGAQFSGSPMNTYTAASNIGDDNTAAGSLSGGPVPTGILNDVAGTITMDLSSWFVNWNDNDIHAGTGKADGFTSAIAAGVWDPVTGAYSLSWLSLTGIGPKDGAKSSFTLEGVASVVPVPPAIWMFGSGLLGLVGMARREKGA